MKTSAFNKGFVRHILSIALIGAIALSVANFANAADKNDQQSKGCLDQRSANVAKDDREGLELWERNLRLDGVEFLEAQVYVGSTCYTPYGSCLISNGPLPVGTACWCPSYGGPVLGRIGLP